MPLLDPSECALLLLNVNPTQLVQLDASPLRNPSNCYKIIHAAAITAAVPIHVAMRDGPVSDEQPPPSASPIKLYSYPSGMARALWAERGLARAIAEHNPTSLILAGSCLEVDITLLALIALAEGLDAYVLLDASLSQDPDIRQLAIDRILQAGVVPLSIVQMIHEWAERCDDDARRRALLSLLEPDRSAPTEAGC